MRDYVRFAFLVGWRKGAISKLTWDDCEDGFLYLRAKNSKNRTGYRVAIKGEIADIIDRRREVPNMTNLVFHRDGQPVREFRKSWPNACKAAGVPDKLFHDLRRSAARNMIRSGTSRTVAKKIGGWKTDSMFDRYNITDDADIENAILQVTAHHANTKVVAIGSRR